MTDKWGEELEVRVGGNQGFPEQGMQVLGDEKVVGPRSGEGVGETGGECVKGRHRRGRER